MLENVTLNVKRGEVLAVVGESGSGKSTLARVICGLRPQIDGGLLLHDQPLPPGYRRRSREQLRHIQLIHQTTDTGLDTRQTVLQIRGRPLAFYLGTPRVEIRKEVSALLRATELSDDDAVAVCSQKVLPRELAVSG